MYTREELFAKTKDQLKQICRNKGIVGYSKKAKAYVVSLILSNQEIDKTPQAAELSSANPAETVVQKQTGPIPIAFPISSKKKVEKAINLSVQDNPDSRGKNNKYLISVSCGAEGGYDYRFDLRGQVISDVMNKLGDLMNIPRGAVVYVNGDKVDSSYVIKEGDTTLEFSANSGDKG